MRESFYVNGYEPKEDEDKISVDGQPYRSKVTVRYVRSSVIVRLGVFIGWLVVIWFIWGEVGRVISKLGIQRSKIQRKSKR
jgi:hypothetical protein